MNHPFHAAGGIAVRWLPVEALTPDPNNARLHSARQIARIADSILAFGFNVPVLVDGKGGVLAGHGRLLAARRLGLKEVPTIALDHLDEAGRRAFTIADNRLAELASWDQGRLAVELEALNSLDLDFSLSATGFELKEIELKVGGDRGSRQQRRGPPVARAGDAWALGPHRLACALAREAEAFLAIDAAIRRWQALSGESARLHPGGETFASVGRARRGIRRKPAPANELSRERIPSPPAGVSQGGGSGPSSPGARGDQKNRKIGRDPPPQPALARGAGARTRNAEGRVR